MSERVLISTLSAQWGGVITMLEFITAALIAGGKEPVLAWYEPYRMAPELSVPSYRLGTRKVGHRRTTALGGLESHALGAWLPELEFTHYQATSQWRRIMGSCDRFLGISGNIMVATPFMQTGRPFLSWVATGWEEDRKDRVRQFGRLRSLLDHHFNRPRLLALERQLVRTGTVLALSEHTRKVINSIAGMTSCANVLPMPIDYELFRPQPARVQPGRIGFSGRLDDPRKNLRLLLQAASLLARGKQKFEIVLLGGSLPPNAAQLIAANGLEEHVVAHEPLERPALADILATLDVFVVPSHQEGLCIAALEAMSCGCPVVSTRCGGPEEFVRDDETGYLVDFDPGQMAAAIERIVGDRALQSRLSQNARQFVRDRYNRDRCEAIFWESFEHNDMTNREEAA